MRLVTHERTTTAQCSGLPGAIISYLAIVSLVPVFLGDGMPTINPADLKRRRRVASLVLLSDSRGGETAKRKHLVDGQLIERLPFNANGPFSSGSTPGSGSASVSEPGPRVNESTNGAVAPPGEPESISCWQNRHNRTWSRRVVALGFCGVK